MPQRGQIVSEARQLNKVQRCQLLKCGAALVGKSQSYDAPVVGVFDSPDEIEAASALDEFDRAVVPEQQVPGHVADRWAARIVVPPDCQQQLVMRGGQADCLCLPLAPMHVLAQASAKCQQTPVCIIVEFTSSHDATLLQVEGRCQSGEWPV